MTDNQKLANRIARLLENEHQPADLAAIFASIEKINHRLDKLEVVREEPSAIPPAHSSQEKFTKIAEFVDELFAAQGSEKACAFEPNDRPCDHCSMCSSRGF